MWWAEAKAPSLNPEVGGDKMSVIMNPDLMGSDLQVERSSADWSDEIMESISGLLLLG